MSFNITEGAGKTIFADTVSDKEVQRVKMTTGDSSTADLVDKDNPLPVTVQPVAEGGLSVYRNLDLDEAGAVMKASPGKLYSISIYNVNASVRYVKLYNKTSVPAPATDTPVLVYPVVQGWNHFAYEGGAGFAAGIALNCVTGIADTDTGAPGTAETIVAAAYK